jgi:hypothetical protein
MQYKPITINYENKTILGVDFSSVSDFDAAVNALGTVWSTGKLCCANLFGLAKCSDATQAASIPPEHYGGLL